MEQAGNEVKERIRSILSRMAELEKELEEELHEREGQLLYQISNRKVRFEEEIRAAHKRLRVGVVGWFRQSELRNVLSAPIIYAMILPISLLDLSLSIYQALCFPLYRVSKVDRSEFITIDRHRLEYLNSIEKFNCVFCGYANGVLAFAREVAARTEQYWCPIKHATRALGSHARYADFLDYGDPSGFHEAQGRLRAELACQGCQSRDE